MWRSKEGWNAWKVEAGCAEREWRVDADGRWVREECMVMKNTASTGRWILVSAGRWGMWRGRDEVECLFF